MKYIIDIPEVIIKACKDDLVFFAECEVMREAVNNGTPLIECEAEDCISRENLQITLFEKCNGNPNYRINYHNLKSLINKMPSVYPKNDNSVLEDIKAELQNISYSENCYGDDYDIASRVVSLEEACDVIDKHISGKEQE